MKICQYCGCTVEDGANVCPHCSGTGFAPACKQCGAALVEGVCPACEERREAQSRAEEERLAKKAKGEKIAAANQGLVWKSVLTLFLPFVGGYFLAKEEVNPVARYLAMGWCVAFPAIGLASAQRPIDFATVLTVLLFLGPVIKYAVLKLMGRRASR